MLSQENPLKLGPGSVVGVSLARSVHWSRGLSALTRQFAADHMTHTYGELTLSLASGLTYLTKIVRGTSIYLLVWRNRRRYLFPIIHMMDTLL